MCPLSLIKYPTLYALLISWLGLVPGFGQDIYLRSALPGAEAPEAAKPKYLPAAIAVYAHRKLLLDGFEVRRILILKVNLVQTL
jgi:hypothetical protein